MKQRPVVIALALVTVVSVAVGIVRRFPHHAGAARPALSARLLPQPSPVLNASSSASALPVPPPPPRERPPYLDTVAKTLPEQRDALFTNMKNQLDLPPGALEKIEAIFAASDHLGQGEPKITKHPMTRAECRAIRDKNPQMHAADARCGAPNMVTVFDPAKGETADSAELCMDQFEFPNLACEYPVTWVRPSWACSSWGRTAWCISQTASYSTR